VEPPTGQSTSAAPLNLTWAAIFSIVCGRTVLISTKSLRVTLPLRSPDGALNVASSAAASVTMLITSSDVSASSRAVSATFAPASASGLVFSRVRFHTVTS
jgi:hypothetical protein